MLHVLTVHYNRDDWIAPQLHYLRRWAPPGTRVYAALEGVDPAQFARFDVATDLRGTHPAKLNQLAAIAMRDAAPGDHLCFVDGDAFPVAPVARLLTVDTALIAVRRDENLGDIQPHPCFCVTTAGFWRDIEGDWERGYEWRNALGAQVTDTGGNLLGKLRARGIAWRPLTRLNTVDLHPLWFAVYGDAELGPVCYHHGAGFRPRGSRLDAFEAGFSIHQLKPRTSLPVIGGVERRLLRAYRELRRRRWAKRHRARVGAIAAEVFGDLCARDDFYERFLAGAHAAPGGDGSR